MCFNFFILWLPRPRPHNICTSIAHISLRGVRRTTSSNQVSTDHPGKYNFSIDEGCATLQDIVTFLAKNAFTEACCL